MARQECGTCWYWEVGVGNGKATCWKRVILMSSWLLWVCLVGFGGWCIVEWWPALVGSLRPRRNVKAEMLERAIIRFANGERIEGFVRMPHRGWSQLLGVSADNIEWHPSGNVVYHHATSAHTHAHTHEPMQHTGWLTANEVRRHENMAG